MLAFDNRKCCIGVAVYTKVTCSQNYLPKNLLTASCKRSLPHRSPIKARICSGWVKHFSTQLRIQLEPRGDGKGGWKGGRRKIVKCSERKTSHISVIFVHCLISNFLQAMSESRHVTIPPPPLHARCSCQKIQKLIRVYTSIGITHF